jgi:sulfide:quinone oxidoreductase
VSTRPISRSSRSAPITTSTPRPDLTEGGNEFYSVEGAERVGELLPKFSQGRVIVGVCGAPFKCPPAPSECALLLHDYLSTRGVRDA